MIHIKKLLSKAINKLGIKKETELYQVSCFLNESIGELFPSRKEEHLTITFIKNGVAFIKIKNFSEASLFYLRRHEILEWINKKLQNNFIKDLRFLN